MSANTQLKKAASTKSKAAKSKDAQDNSTQKQQSEGAIEVVGKDVSLETDKEKLPKQLSSDERTLLQKLEQQLDKSYLDIALAFREIKNKHLWREEFDSFEDYCEIKVGRSRRYVAYMVTYVDVREELEKEHDVPERLLPTSEAQVRPLGKFRNDSKKRKEVWLKGCEIAGDAVPSREQVQKAVQELSGDTSSKAELPPLKEGDCVRLIRAYKDDEQIKALVRHWGFVEKVSKNGNATVEFPQKRLNAIPRDALTAIKVKFDDKDKGQQQRLEEDREEVFKKLQEIQKSKEYREPIVQASLSFLVKKQDAQYTPLEKELLGWLLEHLSAKE